MIYISKIIVGIDEAGRGPVIGPLVLCAYAIEEEKINKLEELGVKDSKMLTKKKREQLYPKLVKLAVCYKTKHLSAIDIDELRKKNSLNIIEQQMMIKLVKELKLEPQTIYIDAADVNEKRFGVAFEKEFPHSEIISKHGADKLFPVVSAASIIAKVERDNVITEIKNELGVDLGSGYPSDPKTKKFLVAYFKKYQRFPKFVRTSWDTAKKIREQYKQKRNLEDYFN
ncbi:MAG: ribonuclease HII [Candidatus Heimdallarchaeaceae archaeon]